MTDEQRASYIISQSVCAMAEIEAMKVENVIAALRNEYPLRTESDFQGVVSKYQLDHNSVISYFMNY
jgi:hypothetical protein